MSDIHRFAFPTTIHFGPGARKLVAEHLRGQGVTRPLIVTDRILSGLPVFKAFLHELPGLEVAVFAGGQSTVTLDDGTVLSQSAPTDPFTPGAPTHAAGAIPMATAESDLQTCDACAWDDPANHVWKVVTSTQADSITAGSLTISVSGSPTVKRFLFSVRH